MNVTRESAIHHCRTCLKDLETNIDDLAPPALWYHLEQTSGLTTWIQKLTALQIRNICKDSDYPQYVCEDCYSKFREFNEFRELVCRTAAVLEDLFTRRTHDVDINSEISIDSICIKQEKIDLHNGVVPNAKHFLSAFNSPNYTLNKMDEINIKLEDIDLSDTVMENSAPFFQDYNQNSNDGYLKSNLDDVTSEPDDVEYILPTEPVNNVLIAESSNDANAKPKRSYKYKCKQCARSYIHKYSYIAHLRKDHLGIERAFECELCHKKYTKFCNLFRHMRVEHSCEVGFYKCQYANCDRSFGQSKARLLHYEVSHGNGPLNLEFDSSTALELNGIPSIAGRYLRRHICTVCSEEFETLYNLQFHMAVHATDMKYVCSICGKRKISQSKLQEHIFSVHQRKTFPCHLCTKKFKSSSHLGVHVAAVHKGLRPYACQYCPAAFAAKNTLKIHVRTHTGEKPFACEICGRRFAQLTPMKRHRLTHGRGRRNEIVNFLNQLHG